MVARGTLDSLALWGSRSADDVRARSDCHREARWRSSYGASCPDGLVRGPPNEHALGRPSSCLFQWRSRMDLSHHPLSSRDEWRAGRGNRGLAGRHRDLARVARILSWFDRDSQSHSGVFFSEDLRLRRHDYSVNIAGGFKAAQLTSDYVVANGISLPTRRRAYTRGPDRRPIMEMLMVAIDFSEVRFE